MIIYTVANGFLDDVPVGNIKAWERDFHVFMTTKYPQVGEALRREKALSKDTEQALRRGIEEYKNVAARG